jgi:hypothetical protein
VRKIQKRFAKSPPGHGQAFASNTHRGSRQTRPLASRTHNFDYMGNAGACLYPPLAHVSHVQAGPYAGVASVRGPSPTRVSNSKTQYRTILMH